MKPDGADTFTAIDIPWVDMGETDEARLGHRWHSVTHANTTSLDSR